MLYVAPLLSYRPLCMLTSGGVSILISRGSHHVLEYILLPGILARPGYLGYISYSILEHGTDRRIFGPTLKAAKDCIDGQGLHGIGEKKRLLLDGEIAEER